MQIIYNRNLGKQAQFNFHLRVQKMSHIYSLSHRLHARDILIVRDTNNK